MVSTDSNDLGYPGVDGECANGRVFGRCRVAELEHLAQHRDARALLDDPGLTWTEPSLH